MSANDISSGNAQLALNPTCMESVNRVTKLPVVDTTFKTASRIYEKVKDYNGLTHWTLSTAEHTLCTAVDLGKPAATTVIKNFEGSIKKVDGALCGGLDYIESKVPAVKLPPGEIVLQVYNNTKEYVNSTVSPAVETAMSYAEPAFKTAMHIVEPALGLAKAAVEPAVEKAKTMMEPYLQPALNKAQAIKDDVMHKVEEYIHLPHQEGEVVECYECQQIKRRLEEANRNAVPDQTQDEQ
ncbi:lipid storage droplets surface-binding protein 2 isoform X1 [Diorhabda sublineata]|uniref:lipid storage droplets surface-binding protein 2 isoform X1 n=1 Tax=Diorhabda sublineata TaxID=1163346 RepID=UPI0024E16702|nr:lipid storage droplets surface-binding protein 2 isoform X1 [Diorhabda sublineata]XP_056640047.1 lipid storage droplets surface-binding protein 2 isoform X1 [Diorhabda sublineata]